MGILKVSPYLVVWGGQAECKEPAPVRLLSRVEGKWTGKVVVEVARLNQLLKASKSKSLALAKSSNQQAFNQSPYSAKSWTWKNLFFSFSSILSQKELALFIFIPPLPEGINSIYFRPSYSRMNELYSISSLSKANSTNVLIRLWLL